MSDNFELVITQGDAHLYRMLSEAPLHIGRAPDNDLSLMDMRLSWYHAILWVERGAVWVRDLSSTNGTFINKERLRGERMVLPGDVLNLGGHVFIRVKPRPTLPSPPRFVLEDLQAGIRHVLAVGTLTPAQAADEAISLPGPLTLEEDGTLTLQLDGEARGLDLDEIFSGTRGQRLRVIAAEKLRTPTIGLSTEPYPYRLTIDLNTPRGSEAILLDRQTEREHRIVAELRVILLYLLAQKILADKESALPPGDRGWCSNADLVVGLWGKSTGSASKLLVLIHRVRRELAAAGFDPEFLEKKRNILRLRLHDIQIR